jgi:hypothetical protein
LCALSIVAPHAALADSVTSGVFVRGDTDRTIVVSPRIHVDQTIVKATRLDVSYSADVWTSASVDIRASASLPVTEQRDELDLGLTHEFADLTLSGGYRYSVENDYISHGLSGGASLDLADNNSTLAIGGYLFGDTVGRAGWPQIARSLVTVGTRLSFTQLLGTATLGQLTYEIGYLDGYQASPYRFVGFGGTGFGCELAIMCLPEHEPDTRMRQAAALILRQGLSDRLSAAGSYRLYRDSWGLLSHTWSAQLGWLLSDDSLVSLRYRFYWQSGVNFYREIYQDISNSDGYTTRDREQSPMSDHRLGAELEHRVALDARGSKLVFRASVGGYLFSYPLFVGLRQSKALELSFAVSLER